MHWSFLCGFAGLWPVAWRLPLVMWRTTRDSHPDVDRAGLLAPNLAWTHALVFVAGSASIVTTLWGFMSQDHGPAAPQQLEAHSWRVAEVMLVLMAYSLLAAAVAILRALPRNPKRMGISFLAIPFFRSPFLAHSKKEALAE